MAAMTTSFVFLALLLCFVSWGKAATRRHLKGNKLLYWDPCEAFQCDPSGSCDYLQAGCACKPESEGEIRECYTENTPSPPPEDPCDGFFCNEYKNCDFVGKGCTCDWESEDQVCYTGNTTPPPPPTTTDDPEDPCTPDDDEHEDPCNLRAITPPPAEMTPLLLIYRGTNCLSYPCESIGPGWTCEYAKREWSLKCRCDTRNGMCKSAGVYGANSKYV